MRLVFDNIEEKVKVAEAAYDKEAKRRGMAPSDKFSRRHTVEDLSTPWQEPTERQAYRGVGPEHADAVTPDILRAYTYRIQARSADRIMARLCAEGLEAMGAKLEGSEKVVFDWVVSLADIHMDLWGAYADPHKGRIRDFEGRYEQWRAYLRENGTPLED